MEIHGGAIQQSCIRETAAASSSSSSPSSSASLPSQFVGVFQHRLLSVQLELCELLPRKKGEDRQRQPASSSSSSSSASHRDIARLLSVKVPTYAPVRMNRVEPLVAVCRIGLQCWIECCRLRHVSSAQQLRDCSRDLYALQHSLPEPLRWEACSDEHKLIHAQLDQVQHSIRQRCPAQLADELQAEQLQRHAGDDDERMLTAFMQQQQQRAAHGSRGELRH